MSVPIVFLHRGSASYLTYSLFQARSSNPGSEVILLGDRYNRGVARYFGHHRMSEYFRGAKEFSAVYEHMSSNPSGFELFCFQRWFVLRDFMRARAIPRCIVADSDTMIYSELSSLWNRYRRFDLAMHEWSPAVVFVGSVDGLERFCRYCMELYTREDYQQRLRHRYADFVRTDTPGGNCDMVAFDWYRREYPDRVAETGSIIDGATGDAAINVSHGFEMRNGTRQIEFRDNCPYGRHLELQRLIRFHALHCQGASKSLMPQLYRGAPIPENFVIETAEARWYRRARRAVAAVLPPPLRQQIRRLRTVHGAAS